MVQRGMQKNFGTLSGNILAIPYKFNILLTSNIKIPLWDISPSDWNPYSNKKMGKNGYNSFICNCQNLEIAQVSLHWGMDTLDHSIYVWWNKSNEKEQSWYVQQAITESPCIILNERGCSQKRPLYQMISLKWHSCKGKTIGAENSSGCQK